MFSYPLDFPAALVANSLSIVPRDAVSRSESAFSFEDQVYDWGGEMWTLKGTLPLMTRENARLFQAFLLKLKGKYGTFLYPIQDGAEPLGTWAAAGSPAIVQVDGAVSARSHELPLKGLIPGATGKAGDYINIGSGGSTRLHMLVDDAVADGAGEMTVNIWPATRGALVDGMEVVTSNCKGLFRLTQNFGWDVDVNKHYMLQFGALEVV